MSETPQQQTDREGRDHIGQQTTAHEPHRFRIGAFEATVVSDGVIPITDAIVASTPPRHEIDRALGGAGIEGNEVPLDVNVLALDTGDEGLVLVDAGAGDAVPFPGGGRLLAALAAAGIRPGDVGTVVLTHAHADHIGGLMGGNGDAAFPNARYLISSRGGSGLQNPPCWSLRSPRSSGGGSARPRPQSSRRSRTGWSCSSSATRSCPG